MTTISRIGGVPQDVYIVGGDSAPLPAGAASESTLADLLARISAAKTLATIAIAASASGDTTLVAAVAGQRHHVIGLFLSVSAAVNVKLRSGSTDISGLFYGQTAGNGIVLPHAGDRGAWWARTAVNEALILNLSAAVAVGGLLVYYTE